MPTHFTPNEPMTDEEALAFDTFLRKLEARNPSRDDEPETFAYACAEAQRYNAWRENGGRHLREIEREQQDAHEQGWEAARTRVRTGKKSS